MQSSNIPAVFNIPWGNSAVSPYIHAVPQASQIAITPGAASLTDGFVPLNFTNTTAGGVPPFGSDMNGILNQITAWLQWVQAGGPVQYSAAFQTAIGGYPMGAIIQSATVPGTLWHSSTENNLTDPDTGGAGWARMTSLYQPAGNFNSLLNGSTNVFTLPQVPIGSVAIFKNGAYNSGYCTFSGATVTWTGAALQAGDTFEYLEYRY